MSLEGGDPSFFYQNPMKNCVPYPMPGYPVPNFSYSMAYYQNPSTVLMELENCRK